MLKVHDLPNEEVEAVEEHHYVQLSCKLDQYDSRFVLHLSDDKVADLHHEGSHKDEDGRRFQAGTRDIPVELPDWPESPDTYRHEDSQA